MRMKRFWCLLLAVLLLAGWVPALADEEVTNLHIFALSNQTYAYWVQKKE